MITKEEGLFDDCMSYTVHCDFCPHAHEYGEIYSWDDLMCEMRKGGWKSTKDKEEWKHACSVCAEKLEEREKK